MRLVVLVSGSGSNLQAVMDACSEGRLNAEVTAVFSNRTNAYAIQRASRAGIPYEIFPWQPFKQAAKSRQDYDAALAEAVRRHAPDFVVLAGWMWLLSRAFLVYFPMRVINLHPALPGMFPGTDAIERALAAYRCGRIRETGVMVHYVPDEGVDDGPVIAQATVPILSEDTLESLARRIHKTEHTLLVSALAHVIDRQIETSKEFN